MGDREAAAPIYCGNENCRRRLVADTCAACYPAFVEDRLAALVEQVATLEKSNEALREAACLAGALEIGWHRPYTKELAKRQAAEARVARLEEALREIVACPNKEEDGFCRACRDLAEEALAKGAEGATE